MNRQEKLDRYRNLRAINKRQQTEALDLVSTTTMLDFARRLGLARGRTVILDNPEVMTLVYDLAVHVGKGGRSRAIDRYADKVRPPPGSDEAMVLNAARRAKFTIWKVERRHEVAGLRIYDIAADETHWLIDESLEISCSDGVMCASRLMQIEDFVMTCGAFVPAEPLVLVQAARSMPRVLGESYVEVVQDPRFVLAIYRAALRTGITDGMAYRDPGEEDMLEIAFAG